MLSHLYGVLLLTLLGTSHHSTGIDVRERFAFDASDATAAMHQIVDRGWADEAVLLSTCNRTELYTAGLNVDVDRLISVLAAHAGLEAIEARQFLYVKHGWSCAEHLYRVTSGMDSLILGEAQIQGQVKAALERAASESAAGKVVGAQLSKLFQGALAVGGRVRNETDLCSGAASVPGAAVALAKKVLGKLHGKRVLIIGAGQMSSLLLEQLADENAAALTIASRTRDSAEQLARRFDARSAGITELQLLIASHDLILTATSCPQTILSAEIVAAARAHTRESVCVIDIAVPRDTDPAVANLPNVFLFDIDDLQQIVDENLARRRAHWPAAERIVLAAVAEYRAWCEARSAVPVITKLRADVEKVRQAELALAFQSLPHLAPAERERIEILTQQLVNKVLHGPTVRLRDAAMTEQRDAVLQAASYLFE